MCSKIFKFRVIDSTHRFAVKLIEQGRGEECVVVADNQTDAIGRCGRHWESLRGNLFMSMIKPLPTADFGQVSLAVACAVHEAILSFIDDKDNLHLHWPNDIYYKNFKMSGILLSVVNNFVVISVGVNVNSSPVLPSAISMSEISAGSFEVKSVFELVTKSINEWMDGLEKSGFFGVHNYWLRYVNEIHRNVVIKNGDKSLSGIFMGLDYYGRLILRCGGRNLHISSGDMFVSENDIVVHYE